MTNVPGIANITTPAVVTGRSQGSLCISQPSSQISTTPAIPSPPMTGPNGPNLVLTTTGYGTTSWTEIKDPHIEENKKLRKKLAELEYRLSKLENDKS